MNGRNKLAFACLAIPTLVELGLGVVYFTASEAMRYHQQVIDVAWPDLPQGVRTMLVTLLNGYGSAHVAVGVALACLIAIPLRRGERWARWAILAVGLPLLAATAYLSTVLGITTGAQTRWQGAIALLALFLVGAALFDPSDRALARPTG